MRHLPLLAAFPLLLTSALAQTCALRGHYRIVNTVNNVPGSELRIDTGWQTTAPLITPGSNSNSNPQGCFSNGSCTSTADYGYLRVTGAGSAQTCSAGGVFLWLDEWIGGQPKAQFRDRLTVVAPGLPNGTPVQVRASTSLAGFANLVDASPSVSLGAILYVNGNFAGQLGGVGAVSQVLNTTVGAALNVEGHLNATLRASGVLAGTPSTASYALDLTAAFDLTALTPGVTLQACSGAAYNQLAARATTIGTGCGTTPPTLAATAPQLGTTCTLTTSGAPANAPTFLGLALGSAVAVPFGACTLRLDPASAVLNLLGATSPGGQVTGGLTIPNSTSLAGFALTAQSLPLAGNGPFLGLAELSNGVELRVGF